MAIVEMAQRAVSHLDQAKVRDDSLRSCDEASFEQCVLVSYIQCWDATSSAKRGGEGKHAKR
jgi:hypothetical protein